MGYKNIRKHMLVFIALFVLTLSFTQLSVADEETINVVCTNSILADFTSNLITENVTIDYIMPSGVCPAYYDTKPSDVNKIVNADIIISFSSHNKIFPLLNNSAMSL